MPKSWKTMTETQKPVRGFTYECEAGHQWFVAIDQWENRGPNHCQECGDESEPGQPG